MTISTVISYYQAQWNQKAFKKRFGEKCQYWRETR